MWSTQGGYDSYNPNNTQGGGGYMSPGMSASNKDSKSDDKDKVDYIMPVTISEIIYAHQNVDEFFSDNIKLSQVTFVGLVLSVKELPVRLDYEVGDCTGPSIEVKQFVDNREDVPENEKIKSLAEKTYVRVSGHIRLLEGKRTIVAFKIVPLTDINELTVHILEVIHSHLMYKSNPNLQNKGKAALTNDYDTSSVGIPGLGHMHNQVHRIIKSCTTEEGCSIDEIIKKLRGVPENTVKDVIDFLSGEGHIYSTISESHFKITDG
ncbi:replication protein A 32 kDa subunit isoform X3 [Octopus bimaculoides]|uniref:replication protein A 32 kDa subunit isoform X3 n=1 Tax=Octopus bimaculoides TaxID=37653 RepID=UPI00071D4BCE|nr:replication protein A 32 kDa subunit isoform X3 [Octopus bimaculoides]|eukprot:XP_014773402.1 PREDICTED: replication protein A 32 kDa subunit-like isoform X3 [Octopus bimaculoides]